MKISLLVSALVLFLSLLACGSTSSSVTADSGSTADAAACGDGGSLQTAQGDCFACLRAHCATAATTCSGNCSCKDEVLDFVPFASGVGGDALCGANPATLHGADYEAVVAMQNCMVEQCNSPCCGAADASAD